MNIRFDESGAEIIVFLSEKLTFKDHQEFNKGLEDVKGKNKAVCYDLRELSMIDSAGIGMLFLAQKLIEAEGNKISIRNPNGQVKRIFDITSLDKQISIVEE